MANEQVDYLTNIGRHSLAGGLDADTFDAPSTDDFDFDDTVVAVLGHGDGGDFGDEFGLDGGDGVYADEDAGNEQAADGFVDDAHPNDDMTDSNAFEFEITYEDEENKEGKEQPTLSLGSGVGISNTPTASNATLGVSLNKGADDESEIGYESEEDGVEKHGEGTTVDITQEDALQAQGTELEAGIGNDTDISAGSATTLGLPDIVVIWNGERYSLFGKEDDDPDTFFLTDVAVMDLPLSDFLHRLRHVIASEMSSSDELVVRVGQLAFQFGPKSPQKFLSRTFREILECYEKLTMNDGAPSSTMILSLVSLRDCEERFAELLQHADLGKGLSEVVDFASELQVDESSTASALEEKEQYDERDQVNEAIAEADSGNAESQGQRLSTEHIYGWPEGVEPYYDEDGRLVAVKDLPAHGKEQMYHELRSEYSAEQLYGYPKGVEPIYDNEARLIAVKDLPSYGMAEEFYDYTGHSPQGYIKMEKTNDDSQDLDEEATNNNESLSDGDLETTAQDTGEDEVQTDYVFADGSLERYEAESDNTQTYTAAPGANDLEDPTYVPGDSDETDPLIQNGRLDNGHSVDAADIFDNVNAGEQIQSLDPAGPQNLEGFDATVGEISWEDGDDTHPDESAMIGATELSTSFSGKRSRQTDATESLANESDHKRRRT
ncbi:hypothetical protein P8C59_004636 [Phyllachora maydis]|uniref:Uncharacterized protein n=1 Tax=Phyllachora maydis TaxID=1825666 RepID=A0AAD9I342_9PEZI|nr:hypothetical protein P8C59_004636 [Phyllachora maydis]